MCNFLLRRRLRSQLAFLHDIFRYFQVHFSSAPKKSCTSRYYSIAPEIMPAMYVGSHSEMVPDSWTFQNT